jgi:hypothetical protein
MERLWPEKPLAQSTATALARPGTTPISMLTSKTTVFAIVRCRNSSNISSGSSPAVVRIMKYRAGECLCCPGQTRTEGLGTSTLGDSTTLSYCRHYQKATYEQQLCQSSQ